MSMLEPAPVIRAAQDYVVGYVFRPDMGAVALIEKRKPAWQAGKLNGVGGKIEPGEPGDVAMAREFYEEAGLVIHPDDWLHFRTEQFMHTTPGKSDQFVGTRVLHYAYRCKSDLHWLAIRTMEAERIVKIGYPFDGVLGWQVDDPMRTITPLIYNMAYLIPMAATMLQQPPENRPVP